ncbi:MAG: OmpH family outer membrane protein [Salibacteraceae bacterium]
MKVLFKISIVAAVLLSALATTAQKAGKFGHINSNDLLLVMPEKDTAEIQLQNYAKELELQLSTMTTEYEKKYTDYQQNVGSMSEVIRSSKEEEIMDLQNRIQEFQTRAQQSLQKKEAEIMEPLIKKAKDAINEVAKANGYTYIFDSGVGALLYYPEGDNILPLVKVKMGIK